MLFTVLFPSFLWDSEVIARYGHFSSEICSIFLKFISKFSFLKTKMEEELLIINLIQLKIIGFLHYHCTHVSCNSYFIESIVRKENVFVVKNLNTL